MGILSVTDRAQKSLENIQQQMRAFFEPKLIDMGLGKSQIESQTLEELEGSLETVNEAIRQPEQFGIIKIAVSGDTGAYITKITSDANFELGILPLLLERKRLVLDRIRILRGNKKIENLSDLVEQVDDEHIRSKLESEIHELKFEAKLLREQSKEVEQAQKEEQLKTQSELAKLSIELFERRSKVWQSFLERESVATIIGGFLLVVFTISFIVAMFLNVATTEIVTNSFLVILGYFFGQATSRASRAAGAE